MNDSGDIEQLMIKNVKYEDEGWYTCIAGNAMGYKYVSALLTVVEGKASYSAVTDDPFVFCLFWCLTPLLHQKSYCDGACL